MIPERLMRSVTTYRAITDRNVESEFGFGFVYKPRPAASLTLTMQHAYGLIYVLCGAAAVTLPDGRVVSLVAGDALQMNGQAPMIMRCDTTQPWCEAFLNLDRAYIRRWAELLGMDLSSPVLRPGLHASLIRHFEKFVQEFRGAARYHLIHAPCRLQELILEIHQAHRRATLVGSAEDKQMEEARHLLELDLKAEWNMHVMARQVCVELRDWPSTPSRV